MSAGRTFGDTEAIANVDGLREGSYSGKLTFTSPDLGTTVELPVTINVFGLPKGGLGGKVINVPTALREYSGGW